MSRTVGTAPTGARARDAAPRAWASARVWAGNAAVLVLVAMGPSWVQWAWCGASSSAAVIARLLPGMSGRPGPRTAQGGGTHRFGDRGRRTGQRPPRWAPGQ